jgi:hypothetical protein
VSGVPPGCVKIKLHLKIIGDVQLDESDLSVRIATPRIVTLFTGAPVIAAPDVQVCFTPSVH